VRERALRQNGHQRAEYDDIMRFFAGGGFGATLSPSEICAAMDARVRPSRYVLITDRA